MCICSGVSQTDTVSSLSKDSKVGGSSLKYSDTRKVSFAGGSCRTLKHESRATSDNDLEPDFEV